MKKMKKMKKIGIKKFNFPLYKISIFVIFAFSIIGVFVLSNILHENSHRWDYRNIEKEGDDICYLSFNGGVFGTIAYYQFFDNIKNDTAQFKEKEKIGKYTEFKAHAFDFWLYFAYGFFAYIFIKGKLKKLKDEN